MICPYNLSSRVEIQKWNQHPTDMNDSVFDNGGTLINTKFNHMECPKEKCGAWYDGHCNYHGAVD